MVDADGTQAPEPSRSFTDPAPDSASRQDSVVSGFGDAEIARPVKPDPETVRRLVHAALAAEGGDDAPAPRVGGAGQTEGRATGAGPATPDGGHVIDRTGADRTDADRTDAVGSSGPVGAAVSRTTWTHTPGEAPAPGQAPAPGAAPTPGQAPTPGEAASTSEGVTPAEESTAVGSPAPGSAVDTEGTRGTGADPDVAGRGPGDDDRPTAEIPPQAGPTGTAAEAAETLRAAEAPRAAPILRLRRTSGAPPRATGGRGVVRRPSSGSTGLAVALVLSVMFILIAIQFVVSFVDSITGIFG